ncbi:MAG TPA: NUDIX hydrolase [Thermoplasmata archaeon]|nr:NUDIX hydrolase [Thermoplasmata archaeon]
MPASLRGPRVAVDGIVTREGRIVAVIRGNEPFRGRAALPGGFVELGERAEDAVVREVREETGLEARVVRLVGVYSDPARDPRGHVLSVVYELEAVRGALAAGSDAARVILVDPDAPPAMAFDHARILADWRGR